MKHTKNTHALTLALSVQTWTTKWEDVGQGTFLKSYCDPDGPWLNWTIGMFSCMLATPSNQPEESWHKQILQGRIPGMFKASTEQVLKVGLPRLATIDAVRLPNKLKFKVCGVVVCARAAQVTPPVACTGR